MDFKSQSYIYINIYSLQISQNNYNLDFAIIRRNHSITHILSLTEYRKKWRK